MPISSQIALQWKQKIQGQDPMLGLAFSMGGMSCLRDVDEGSTVGS